MTTLTLIACVIAGIGVYNLLCAFADIPTAKTSKMMLLSRKQEGVKKDQLLSVYITRIAISLERFVRLDRLRSAKIQSALSIAGLEMSPRAYVMKAYVTSILTASCAIPAYFIHPLLALMVIGLAITLWFAMYYAAFDYVAKRKKSIEAEIPRFALTIARNLENDRDVLKILTGYKRVVGGEFRKELDQTIADMRTGNYENALIRFESRVGSALLSDVIRGLIGTLRGDDQQMYFKMICFDTRQIELSNLKREAMKRPERTRKYSMMMMVCVVAIYLVVLSVEVIGSLGVFFG